MSSAAPTGGGNEGGYIVASGVPKEVMLVAESPTGKFLRK
jgi:excinuclease UvrABC ATPase subunit